MECFSLSFKSSSEFICQFTDMQITLLIRLWDITHQFFRTKKKLYGLVGKAGSTQGLVHCSIDCFREAPVSAWPQTSEEWKCHCHLKRSETIVISQFKLLKGIIIWSFFCEAMRRSFQELICIVKIKIHNLWDISIHKKEFYDVNKIVAALSVGTYTYKTSEDYNGSLVSSKFINRIIYC